MEECMVRINLEKVSIKSKHRFIFALKARISIVKASRLKK